MEYISVFVGVKSRGPPTLPRPAPKPPLVSLTQVNNKNTGVCGANAAAQCYAAILYHRLRTLPREYRVALQEEVATTRYGQLLLSMISGVNQADFDSEATWRCTEGQNNRGRPPYYYFFVVEQVPALKKLLAMEFVYVSRMHDAIGLPTPDTKTIETYTVVATHLGFFFKKEHGTLDSFVAVIGAPSAWPAMAVNAYTVITRTVERQQISGSKHKDLSFMDLKEVQFGHVPPYITIYADHKSENHEAPVTFSLHDKGVEYEYKLLCATILKAKANGTHATSLVRYQDKYYELDDMFQQELRLSGENVISAKTPRITRTQEYSTYRFVVLVYSLETKR